MARYTVSAEITAGSLREAWEIASHLPRDLAPGTVDSYQYHLRSFSIFDEENNREFSLSIYEKENNEQ